MVKFTPTDEQITLSKIGAKFYKTQNKQWLSYSGGAGTGKTTVMNLIVEACKLTRDEYSCLAFTGKAVTVLLQKGLPASTIHHMIYDIIMEPVVKDGKNLLSKNGKVICKMGFKLREKLRKQVKLLFIDEATMVNDSLMQDLLSFGVPCIFAGDMNQLPPVFGISSVMKKPDFVLTKIMRQAENDPIVFIANKIIHDELVPNGIYGKSCITNSFELDKNKVKHYGIILSAKNKLRESINDQVRHTILGLRSAEPVIGDKIICRQNNRIHELGQVFLANGLVGYIDDIDYDKSNHKKLIIDFKPDFMDSSFKGLEIDRVYPTLPWEEQKAYGISRYEKFEFGYCITVHLSQGSQYPNVLYFDDYMHDAETTRKLRYTAVTRAMKEITIVTNNYRGLH